MSEYIEYGLLGVLLVLIYKKPAFLIDLGLSKINILVLVFLNAYIVYEYGITSGIIMAMIVIVLIDNKSLFSNVKERFNPKLKVWHPQSFSSPCQVSLDRKLKEKAELSKLSASKQLDGFTNEGFRGYQKQLYSEIDN